MPETRPDIAFGIDLLFPYEPSYIRSQNWSEKAKRKTFTEAGNTQLSALMCAGILNMGKQINAHYEMVNWSAIYMNNLRRNKKLVTRESSKTLS